MTGRILRYTVFVVLVLTADQLVGSFIDFLARKQVRDNRIELLINNRLSRDIYILGSSRALNNYNPKTISKATGLTCYNLGVSGSNITFHETLLDLILSRDTLPRMIIYNIDDFGTLYKMDGIIFRKDVLYPYVENHYVNKRICEDSDKNYMATLLMKTYRQNVNFINALKYLVYGREAIDYKTTNFDADGANLLVQRPEDPIPVISDEPQPGLPEAMDKNHVESFIRIQQKCRDHNITLVMVIPPLLKKPTHGFSEAINKLASEQVKLIDFTGTLQDTRYFFNKDHMNTVGANIFSEKVADALSKVSH